MKVLLLSSFRFDQVSRTDIAPPLNLLYVAAMLRKCGVEPILLDTNLIPISATDDADARRLEHIKMALGKERPDIVGISCLTTAHFPFMRQVAKTVRELLPNAKTILGGVHATLFVDQIMANCPEFDYVVMGEGEEQTEALAKVGFGNSPGQDLSQIQSFAWRDRNGAVRVNPRVGYIEDLDSIPMPAWDMVDFPGYYRDHSNWHNPRRHNIKISIPIITTRSCPYDCNFCSAHKTMGRGFRKRSPANVVDEIQYHVDTYGHRYFGFADDNLTLEKRHVMAVCDEISRRGLDIQFESFNGYNLASLDAEVIGALASVGCIYSILPVEHGNDRMRNEVIGKRLPRSKIFEVMSLYKKHGIQTRAMFIMGFPEDTAETLADSMHMIRELDPDMADVFTLIPFPGTKVFDQAIRDNLFIEQIDESRLWDGSFALNTKGTRLYLKPHGMSVDELARWRSDFDQVSAELLEKLKLKRRAQQATPSQTIGI